MRQCDVKTPDTRYHGSMIAQITGQPQDRSSQLMSNQTWSLLVWPYDEGDSWHEIQDLLGCQKALRAVTE